MVVALLGVFPLPDPTFQLFKPFQPGMERVGSGGNAPRSLAWLGSRALRIPGVTKHPEFLFPSP